ncbi:PREDICTED: small integral membrane protein 6 [Chrysochloris asiatica]|uniref:Small integral membrane protein 6 n=1 Tax=Chrysochloris asiatica TaxID=185453 RepID=A0A9B0WVP3_CHRAS|nr:PREDICTED: small integral membrane protein 6 [Chrysochloris asiatica]
MDIILSQTVWKEEFWQNPWDLGGLVIIGLLIATVLLLILFAVVFGLLPPCEASSSCEEAAESLGVEKASGEEG